MLNLTKVMSISLNEPYWKIKRMYDDKRYITECGALNITGKLGENYFMLHQYLSVTYIGEHTKKL